MQDMLTGFTGYLAQERSYSPRTVSRYQKTAEAYLGFLAVRDVDVAVAPRAVLREFLAGSRPSRSGWNNRLAAIRALYEYLMVDEDLLVDPSAGLLRQRVHADTRVPLTFDEMLLLVRTAETTSPPRLRSRDVAILQVLMHSALRVSELTSLDLAQLDLQGHHLLSVQTKGGKRQTVPLSDLVVETIEHYLPGREQLLEGRQTAALFVSSRGARLSVRAVQNLVARIAERAGITRSVSPHLLRHSSAKAFEALTGVRVVQDILGHASLATTQTYLATGTGERRSAVDALATRWREAAERGTGR